MMSRHFTQAEFKCKCGCNTYVFNAGLIIALEAARKFFNAPVTITSSTRCLKHNESVGGKVGSRHLIGEAADIVIKGVHPDDVYCYFNESAYANIIGLGSYGDFTHIDMRGYKARW